jgi:pilus assembly protein CpaB
MRNSGLLWWVSAFVLAAVAGVLTYGLLMTSLPATATAGQRTENTVAIVIAADNIPFRRSIQEEDLAIRLFPVDGVPVGAATSLDQVIGKMSTIDLYANEPILTQQLVTPDVVTAQVALSVPEGRIVLSVPTPSKLISNRLIRPGDFIDLLATFEVDMVRGTSKSATPVTLSLMQSLEIHAIILPATTVEEGPTGVVPTQEGGIFRTADERGQSILLALDPQDALTVLHVLDVGGAIDLALRPRGDELVTETEVVDQFYLADRYRIDLNRN